MEMNNLLIPKGFTFGTGSWCVVIGILERSDECLEKRIMRGYLRAFTGGGEPQR